MRSVLLAGVAILGIGSAQASPARDALTAVTKCTEIAGTAERLQCFDAAATAARNVLSEADRQAAVKPQEEESEGGVLAWFGFAPEEKPVTKPEDFGITPKTEDRPGAPKEISEISAKVIEYAKNAHGKSLFILDNGQVWKQVDGDTSELYHRESEGQMNIRIEKAIMGSFSLYIEGKTMKLKVRRIK
jgi:hypothetical protein